MTTLLLVHHAPSPRLRALLEALESGPAHPDLDGSVELESVTALAVTSDHVLRADGYVYLTPVNFGYMSGALKHAFDTTFYTCLDAVAGRPYALCVHGDGDTSGAVGSVERIATGWSLDKVASALEITGEPSVSDREAATELSATVAAHLSA